MTKKRTKLAAAEARVAKQWPGLSKHRALSSFPKGALAKGAAVESEHVGGNKPLARRIAADHLVEDPKYYDKLARQEAKMKKQKSGRGHASGDADYQMEHRPAGRDGGAPAHDLTVLYPADVYGPRGRELYSSGLDGLDSEALSILHRVRGKPSRPVTIYRAVPKTLTNEERIEGLLAEQRHMLKHGTTSSKLNEFTSTSGWGPPGKRSGYYDRIAALVEDLRSKPPTEKPSRALSSIQPGDWVTITRGYAIMHGKGNLRGRYRVLSKTVKASDIFTDGNSLQEWGYDPSGVAGSEVRSGHAAGRTKGDPTDLNLSALDRELRDHEARGDKTLHRFSPTSMNAMRRLLKAGYLAPAVGQPGHWVLTGQGEMALQGFREREAATAARWAKPGHAAGEAVVIPDDPRVECFTKAISGALKKLAARIEPKGFRLHDISYGTTLYNQGRGVIAGVPGARVSFQAVGPRGARVHFHGSFRYDREDYLVGTLTVTGAESKREWSLTRGKCVEVAKLIAAPSTFPRHEMKLAQAGLASGRSGRRSMAKAASVQEVYETLRALGRRSGIELGKKSGESVIRVDLDARHHAVITQGHLDWIADIYRADHTGTGYAENEEHGPVLEAPALDVAMWIRALMSKAERVY